MLLLVAQACPPPRALLQHPQQGRAAVAQELHTGVQARDCAWNACSLMTGWLLYALGQRLLIE